MGVISSCRTINSLATELRLFTLLFLEYEGLKGAKVGRYLIQKKTDLDHAGPGEFIEMQQHLSFSKGKTFTFLVGFCVLYYTTLLQVEFTMQTRQRVFRFLSVGIMYTMKEKFIVTSLSFWKKNIVLYSLQGTNLNFWLDFTASVSNLEDGMVGGGGRTTPTIKSGANSLNPKPDSPAFNRKDLLSDQPPTQDESKLLNSLLNGYDRRVRPVINASTPVITSIGITLTQIFDMVSPRCSKAT